MLFLRLLPILAFALILLASIPPYIEQIGKRVGYWRGEPLNPLSPQALNPLILRVEVQSGRVAVDLLRTYAAPSLTRATIKVNITHPDGQTTVIAVRKTLPLGTTQRLEVPLPSTTKPCVAVEVYLDSELRLRWASC